MADLDMIEEQIKSARIENALYNRQFDMALRIALEPGPAMRRLLDKINKPDDQK